MPINFEFKQKEKEKRTAYVGLPKWNETSEISEIAWRMHNLQQVQWFLKTQTNDSNNILYT